MTQKIMLPMASSVRRDYAITWSEQIDLARRYGTDVDSIRVLLAKLNELMNQGVYQPQKTANKTRLIIQSYLENSNVTERQGASANGLNGLNP
jgi:hypothetical protein